MPQRSDGRAANFDRQLRNLSFPRNRYRVPVFELSKCRKTDGGGPGWRHREIADDPVRALHAARGRVQIHGLSSRATRKARRFGSGWPSDGTAAPSSPSSRAPTQAKQARHRKRRRPGRTDNDLVALKPIASQREARRPGDPARSLRSAMTTLASTIALRGTRRASARSNAAHTPPSPSQLPRLAPLEYSVARCSKKLACSTPLRISTSHGSGCGLIWR